MVSGYRHEQFGLGKTVLRSKGTFLEKSGPERRDYSDHFSFSPLVMGQLLIPGGSLVVIEDKPCNVTCRALNWTTLPDLSWEIGVPVSHSSYYSIPEPEDLQCSEHPCSDNQWGNGTVTCVAEMKGAGCPWVCNCQLHCVPPPLGKWRLFASYSEFLLHALHLLHCAA